MLVTSLWYHALNLTVLQDLQDLFNPYGSVQECRVLHRYATERVYLGNHELAKGKLNPCPNACHKMLH